MQIMPVTEVIVDKVLHKTMMIRGEYFRQNLASSKTISDMHFKVLAKVKRYTFILKSCSFYIYTWSW